MKALRVSRRKVWKNRNAVRYSFNNLSDAGLIDRIYEAEAFFDEKRADEIVNKNIQKQKNKRLINVKLHHR